MIPGVRLVLLSLISMIKRHSGLQHRDKQTYAQRLFFGFKLFKLESPHIFENMVNFDDIMTTDCQRNSNVEKCSREYPHIA